MIGVYKLNPNYQLKPQFVEVNLLEIRKEIECPICLHILKKAQTIGECLHRFCRECIDKSIRLWNNECPTCHMHFARRSLRDDPTFDSLIAALVPDIEKYEEEELELIEEFDSFVEWKEHPGSQENVGEEGEEQVAAGDDDYLAMDDDHHGD